MEFDFSRREISLKVVYYGPALSGKTTNLQALHRLLRPETRGRLMMLDTKDDRTLFFDMLPVQFDTGGIKVILKLYTVPGQVIHNSTRKLVLANTDAVAFIADSQIDQKDSNNESWRNLLVNMKDNGIDPKQIPVVIQFNKRDLPNVRTDEEIAAMAQKSREPIYKAVAIRCMGVLETFFGLLAMTWDAMNQKHQVEKRFGLSREVFLTQLRQHFDVRHVGQPFTPPE